MNSRNPYTWRSQLPADSDMFFGRTSDIELLLDRLAGRKPQNVSIVGELKIGKSSLAYRVFHKIKEKDDTLAIYMDCNALDKTCDTGNAFFELLNDGFKQALEENRALKEQLGISAETLFTDYREFRSFVNRVSRKNISMAIFLDEFESLPGNEFADDSFFSNLRALVDKPDHLLAFVTISESEVKKLTHKSSKSSRFYNIFETFIIGLLDHDSIRRLRTRGFVGKGFTLSSDDKQKISYYAGNFAFFNQVACAFLWDAKHERRTPDWDGLEMNLIDDYDTLWDRSREERALLKRLLKKNERSNFSLKALEYRGLVIKAEDFYYPFSDFFGQLIEKRFKDKDNNLLEKLIKYIEKFLALAGKVMKIIRG